MKFVKRAVLSCLVLSLLLVTSCRKDRATCSGTSEKTYALSQFHNIVADDNMEVTIVKGNVYSVKANGCNEDLADLVTQVLPDGTLKFTYSNVVPNRKVMRIYITMPELLKLTGSAAAKINVTGMANQVLPMQINLYAASEAIINGTANDVVFELSAAAKLELTGNANVLTGDISGAGLLKADGLAVKQTDIAASGASKAYVTAQDKLYAEASGASIIYYKGNPPTIHTTTSGTGRIIKM